MPAPMGPSSWPSEAEVDGVRRVVAEMSGRDAGDVRVVVSPYRICPLGAHIDHQGGTVSAMTINKGILLGFVPSGDAQVLLRSGHFERDVRLRVDDAQYPRVVKPVRESASSIIREELDWGCYARGALYALQKSGYNLTMGIVGFICGSGLDSSGLSSSAAVGIAYLLALESANNIAVLPTENIELDRLIENGYLGLRNGILDQSAILLSKYGCLTCMNCKTKEYNLINSPELESKGFKILLAFSGLKHSLPNNPGYNSRVSECQEAARVLLRLTTVKNEDKLEFSKILEAIKANFNNKFDEFWKKWGGGILGSKSQAKTKAKERVLLFANASGDGKSDPILCNVTPSSYEVHKSKLEPKLARRAEHYYYENMRVIEGIKAWASGNLQEFGRLISASGLSSIKNYECGCEPMIQLYEILLSAPGIFGARFSGAGFRGCCIAFVDASRAEEAASFVKQEYYRAQPELASQLKEDMAVLICEAGDSARIL